MLKHCKKPFYGWVIVFACVIVTSVGLGLYSSTASAFIIPVCESMHFSRSQYTIHRTIVSLGSAFLAPLYGELARKIGAKKCMLITLAAMIAVSFGYSFATTIWHFYLVAVVNGLMGNGFNFVVIGILINAWFDDKKGVASGIAYCGSGLGGAVMLPIVRVLIERLGWRWTYRAMALGGPVILLPTILFLIKDSPAVMGLTPYRNITKINTSISKGGDDSGRAVGMSLQNALKTPMFWLLITGLTAISACAGCANTHTIPYLQDIGYTPAYASSVMSCVMIILMVSKIVMGAVYDRFGTGISNLILGVSCVIYPILAVFAGSPAIAWSYAFVYGFSASGISVPVSTLVSKYFGDAHFSKIFGVCTMSTSVISSITTPLMGAVYDHYGSYEIAWLALIGIGVCAVVGLIGAELCSRKSTCRCRT